MSNILQSVIVDAGIHVAAAPLNPAFHTRTEPLSAESLLAEMAAAGVDRAVVVPPRLGENGFAAAAAARHPTRLRAVLLVDENLPDAVGGFGTDATSPAVIGARVVIRGAQGLGSAGLESIWSSLSDWARPVLVYAPGSIPLIGEVARRHPQLRIVVDHLGLRLQIRGAELTAELALLLQLAELTNVAVKASALPSHSAQPFPFRDLRRPLEAVIAAFGPRRVFWASDLTQLDCSYPEAVSMMSELVSDPGARRLVMGEAFATWAGWLEGGG